MPPVDISQSFFAGGQAMTGMALQQQQREELRQKMLAQYAGVEAQPQNFFQTPKPTTDAQRLPTTEAPPPALEPAPQRRMFGPPAPQEQEAQPVPDMGVEAPVPPQVMDPQELSNFRSYVNNAMATQPRVTWGALTATGLTPQEITELRFSQNISPALHEKLGSLGEVTMPPVQTGTETAMAKQEADMIPTYAEHGLGGVSPGYTPAAGKSFEEDVTGTGFAGANAKLGSQTRLGMQQMKDRMSQSRQVMNDQVLRQLNQQLLAKEANIVTSNTPQGKAEIAELRKQYDIRYTTLLMGADTATEMYADELRQTPRYRALLGTLTSPTSTSFSESGPTPPTTAIPSEVPDELKAGFAKMPPELQKYARTKVSQGRTWEEVKNSKQLNAYFR